jgi:hypothetical protein
MQVCLSLKLLAFQLEAYHRIGEMGVNNEADVFAVRYTALGL